MSTQNKKKESLMQKVTSLLLVICMMTGLMVPLMSVTAYAEAPASQTTIVTEPLKEPSKIEESCPTDSIVDKVAPLNAVVAAEPSADVWDGTVDTSWYSSSYSEFTIYTAEQLAGLAQLVNNGNTFSGKTIYLGNNIDLDNREWTPIGIGSMDHEDNTTLAFSGTFNGKGHCISGLNVNIISLKRAGLFGTLNGATVTMLGINDASITITQEHVVAGGVIVGFANNSTITKCEVSGNVSVTDTSTVNSHCACAGMIVGRTGGSVVINFCIANGNVSGSMPNDWNAYVGGIVGCADGNTTAISNTYFCGQISAYGYDDGYAGGIIGIIGNDGSASINNCFAVADITSSDFADAIASEWLGYSPRTSNTYYSSSTSSALATSTSYANFQSETWIETNLGWDFDTVWEFRTGSDYPVLQGFDGSGYTPPHTHEFEETSRTEATCTTDGRINYACSSCGATRFEIIEAYSHCIETVIERQVTCTSDGLIVDRCINYGCDYEKHTIIHGEHRYEVTDRQEAACETPGYIEYTCYNCGDRYYEYFEGAHNYVESARVEPQVEVEGSVTYTCTNCGDSYDIILPALTPVLKNSSVLLIQDSLPWAEDVNTSLLETLKNRGVVSSYNVISTRALASFDLSQYGVVFIANDQSTAMYERLAANTEKLENYVRAGGNLIYGACDEGWGGSGHLTHALPGGVTTSNYYSVHNYIVNDLHPIVTGVYTDNRSLRDELLKGNYCSHTYFNVASLPDGYNVILRDANGNPTLVEYNLGDGTVIATGLTWEYFYVRNHYNMDTNYSKYVYDDLVTYMVYMSNTCEHSYEIVETVEATCEENGYTKYVCTLCSYEYMGDIAVAPGHDHVETSRTEGTCIVMGEVVYTCFCGDVKTEQTGYGDHINVRWIIDVPATCVEGSQHKECADCHTILEIEVIPPAYDHVAGDWIIDVEPTATKTGRRHNECIVCGQILDTEIVPVLAMLVIANVEAKVGSTVRVTIDIQNNPGVMGAVLTLNYDSALTLIDAEAGVAWSSLNLTHPGTYNSSCNFVWDGMNDVDTSNGTILTLTFKVPDTATVGDCYIISVSYSQDNIVDANDQPIGLEVINGSITVTQLKGDVNDDGVVDVADVVTLRRYLAGGYDVTINESQSDMNEDGNITIADVIELRRHIVNN